jgi:NAD(P)-dependent dehydrogenase (short-subunit alcohol dehydrogenase family)
MTTAVVSGGGTGIGLAVARRLTERGGNVTLLGRRPDVLADAARQVGATAVVCDVADPEAVRAVLDDLPAEVDVLVNNAGGNTDLGSPEPADGDLAGLAAAWQDNLRSNLISAVLLTAALAPRLADGGRVVTLGSIAARTGAGSYGAAKAAIEAWNIDVARELGPRGITANVVSPGLTVDTEFFRGRLTGDRTARLVAATATGRAGTPDDVAALIDFLAGPDAGHITGQVLHVNGGAHRGH